MKRKGCQGSFFCVRVSAVASRAGDKLTQQSLRRLWLRNIETLPARTATPFLCLPHGTFPSQVVVLAFLPFSL